MDCIFILKGYLILFSHLDLSQLVVEADTRLGLIYIASWVVHLFANHESINAKLLHPPDISTFKDCFFFPSHLRGKDCVQMPHPIFFKFPAELGSDIEIWVKFWFTQMYSHYVILSTVQSIMGNLFHRETWKQTKNEKKIKPLLLNFSSNSY